MYIPWSGCDVLELDLGLPGFPGFTGFPLIAILEGNCVNWKMLKIGVVTFRDLGWNRVGLWRIPGFPKFPRFP